MKNLKDTIGNRSMFKKAFWAWVVALYIIALIPNVTTPKIELWHKFEIRFDYIAHSIFYIILAFCFYLWKRIALINGKTKLLLPFIILAAFIALSTEFLHKIHPSRSFNHIDIIYNFIGIVLGILFIFYMLKQSRNETA